MHIEVCLKQQTVGWLLSKTTILLKPSERCTTLLSKWTISKLAEVAGMSRSSFTERFKQVVGVPPLTYLIDYRLRLAALFAIATPQHQSH